MGTEDEWKDPRMRLYFEQEQEFLQYANACLRERGVPTGDESSVEDSIPAFHGLPCLTALTRLLERNHSSSHSSNYKPEKDEISLDDLRLHAAKLVKEADDLFPIGCLRGQGWNVKPYSTLDCRGTLIPREGDVYLVPIPTLTIIMCRQTALRDGLRIPLSRRHHEQSQLTTFCRWDDPTTLTTSNLRCAYTNTERGGGEREG